MSRLQRKCFLASLLGHAALLVLLVVSAGFSTARPPQTEEVVLLTFIPDRLVEAPVVGGGTPQTAPPPAVREPVVTPPPAAPPKPALQPPPQPKPKPQPEPEAPKTSPTGEKPAPEPRRKIEVNLKPVVRRPETAARDRAREDAEARQRAETERLAQVRQSQLARAVENLSRNLTGSTAVSVPGTGGATYASYTSFVDLVYRQAWAPLKPREISERALTVVARVVIARNGDVVLSEIKRRSGNEAMDRSVRAALDRVRTIGRPFPEGARDDRREFEIEFHLEPTPGAG
jgi:outer membrane biosynthesis protein TonB